MGVIFVILVAVVLIFCLLFSGGCSPSTKHGATCYAPTPSPSRMQADYICPMCGERSVYMNGSHAGALLLELPEIRALVAEIQNTTGAAVSLDESQFCRKCSPKITNPKLVLRIAINGEPVHEIDSITVGDLCNARDYFWGTLSPQSKAAWNSPLKDLLPQLEKARKKSGDSEAGKNRSRL
jgi:hypothetical protein